MNKLNTVELTYSLVDSKHIMHFLAEILLLTGMKLFVV